MIELYFGLGLIFTGIYMLFNDNVLRFHDALGSAQRIGLLVLLWPVYLAHFLAGRFKL